MMMKSLVFVSFLLLCGGCVARSPLRLGMTIGTEPGLDDVVKNGAIEDGWSEQDPHEIDAAPVVQLYQWIDPALVPKNGGFPDPETIIVSPLVTSGNGVITVTYSPVLPTTLATGKSHMFMLEFKMQCKANGTATFLIQFDWAPYKHWNAKVIKNCAVGYVEPRLQIASVLGISQNANVVANGVVQTPFANFVELPSNDIMRMFVWTSSGNLTFGVLGIYTNRLNMAPMAVAPQGNVAYKPGHTLAVIDVEYNCLRSVRAQPITMQLQIGEVATNVVTINWYKTCEVAGPPSGPPAPDDWPPGLIIGVVFLICACVAWVAAALYNYWASGRRGFEVLPCYYLCWDTCACCGLVPPRVVRHTPQEYDDWDDAVTDPYVRKNFSNSRRAQTSSYGSLDSGYL